MLDPKELLSDLCPGDYVQVITEHFNGGIGKLRSIHETYIYVEPFDLTAGNDEVLSISQEILFQLTEIKLIIKVTNITEETFKNADQ